MALVWLLSIPRFSFFWWHGRAVLHDCGISSHVALRKHAYLNILQISPPKNENFQIKNSDSFNNSAQNIDCGYSLEPPRQGGSNEYPQSMCLSRNKKNNAYPCKPQFYYIKVRLRGSKLYRHVFVMFCNCVDITMEPLCLAFVAHLFFYLRFGKAVLQNCVFFFPDNFVCILILKHL